MPEHILTDAEVDSLYWTALRNGVLSERGAMNLIAWGRHWKARAVASEGERDEARGIAIRTSENLANAIADRLAAEGERDSWRRLARDDSPYCEVHQ